MSLRFVGDEMKPVTNLAKHGISFDEAQTGFGDPNSVTLFDAHHSDKEERYNDIGTSASGLSAQRTFENFLPT